MEPFLFLFLSILIISMSVLTIWMTIRLLERYKERFLGYYLFYLIFVLLFGFFAYMAPYIVRAFVLNQAVVSQGSEKVLQFFPFFSIPLIIVSFFLYYLIFIELKNRRASALFSVFYFGIQGAMLICTSLLYFRVPFLNLNAGAVDFTDLLNISFLGTNATMSFTVLLSALMTAKSMTYSPRKKMIIQFSSIHLLLKMVKLGLFLIVDFSGWSGMLYITLFVGGDIFPVLYLNIILSEVTGTSAVAAGNPLRMSGLSKREKEIVELICQGKSNKEIADTLFISLQTVKTHTYRVYRKLGIKNRVQLANMAGEKK